MRAYHHPHSALHDPRLFYRRGSLIEHPERASRYIVCRDAVATAGHSLCDAEDFGLAPIHAVHDRAYVAFLRDCWARRGELPSTEDEIVTGHFARPHMHRRPESLLGLTGLYTADTSTPITAGTWDAVYGAAQVAISAADAALIHGRAYALCRPPGHHAYADSAGGFCYLNNSGLAAERMRSAIGARVGILDIDVHHGNGSQGLFYCRSDIVTVSVHADPSTYFPFFAGYADETGLGDGEGFNHNLPLAHRAGDDIWLAAIAEALDLLARHDIKALVVALGLDAAAQDPLGVLNVSTEGFAAAAKRIAMALLPTAIVQEGGYLCDALPINLAAFLGAFDEAASVHRGEKNSNKDPITR